MNGFPIIESNAKVPTSEIENQSIHLYPVSILVRTPKFNRSKDTKAHSNKYPENVSEDSSDFIHSPSRTSCFILNDLYSQNANTKNNATQNTFAIRFLKEKNKKQNSKDINPNIW